MALALVMYPRIGDLRHGVDGRWPLGQVQPDGGGWTTRAKRSWCGEPTEGEYTWIKTVEDINCPDCIAAYVSVALIKEDLNVG